MVGLLERKVNSWSGRVLRSDDSGRVVVYSELIVGTCGIMKALNQGS
jgi:hypothetical protein